MADSGDGRECQGVCRFGPFVPTGSVRLMNEEWPKLVLPDTDGIDLMRAILKIQHSPGNPERRIRWHWCPWSTGC